MVLFPCPDASHSWSDENNYDVKVQARCATHTDKISAWSAAKPVSVGEAISTLDIPSGPSSTDVGESASFSTGGAVSSLGHGLEYSFDWEENAFPLWSFSNYASIYWPLVGIYSVRVRARCALHAQAVSAWSDPQPILISPYEIITTPDIPAGPASTHVGETETYSESSSYSSSGHRIEFQFDWGDGSQSLWSSSSNASHSWSLAGQYVIRIQARCRDHIGRFSSWSDGLTVTVD